MKVKLAGPDDVLPRGTMFIHLPGCPRVGELVVWEENGLPKQYFRVTEVCWIFVHDPTRPPAEYMPEIGVEPVDGP